MLDIAIEVLNILDNHNYQAYIVGGFVRDYCLSKISDDIDICTNAHIDDIKKIFNDIVSVDEIYGAIVIRYKDIDIEITTFRKDISYENNRKPTIEYVDSLREDITRRDFTINTLCMDKDRTIVDLLNGIEDLDNHLIRSVGDPYFKMAEDSLRILRAIRFATTLNFNIDKLLKSAIIEHKDLLKHLSYERRRQELDRIFDNPNNRYGIELLLELKLDKELSLNNLANVNIIDDKLGIWAQIEAPWEYFNKDELNTINKIKALLKTTNIDRYTLYRYGLDLIKVVYNIKHINYYNLEEEYNLIPIKSKADMKMTFNELKDILNIDDNKQLGIIYNELEKLIVYGQLNNDAIDIKNYILTKYQR